jgi:hypothetical protein
MRETGWDGHVSESRWTKIPERATHQGSRRRALSAEVSLDMSRQLSSLGASQQKTMAAGEMLPGDLKAQ